jgi:hypothetical protein
VFFCLDLRAVARRDQMELCGIRGFFSRIPIIRRMMA